MKYDNRTMTIQDTTSFLAVYTGNLGSELSIFKLTDDAAQFEVAEVIRTTPNAKTNIFGFKGRISYICLYYQDRKSSTNSVCPFLTQYVCISVCLTVNHEVRLFQ